MVKFRWCLKLARKFVVTTFKKSKQVYYNLYYLIRSIRLVSLFNKPSRLRLSSYLIPSSPYVFASNICSASHFSLPLYKYWCNYLREVPRYHRKQWEFVYICQSLYERGLLQKNKTGIGFGVGREPLVAVFAQHEVKVTATDLPIEKAAKSGWVETNQYATDFLNLNDRSICDATLFVNNVSYHPVDMNNIPSDLKNFDFCWSACAMEHLGTIENGIRFVRKSLDCLKPGGYAIHTTEFNLSSNKKTIDNSGCVLFRKKDIERLVEQLVQDGFIVEPLDLNNGCELVEKYVDIPPYGDEPHLRLLINKFICTSVGLIIQKPIFK